jgi:hypothetical protein
MADKLLYIQFDSGAPTSVDEVALSYDFVTEPPPSNRVRELNLSAAHTYWDQMRSAVGFQYRDAVAVTPHNTNYIRTLPNGMPEEFSLFVGTGGAVAVTMASGATATFGNVSNGTHLSVLVIRVLSAGTGASNIVALSQ